MTRAPERQTHMRAPREPPLIRYQRIMLMVLIGLAPAAMAAIYFFGLRVLAMLTISSAAGLLVEWLFCRPRREPISMAVFVTTVLLALVVPPTLPLWMVALGSAFAVAFGKMVFGGFGRNVFNPALVGRCFLFVCFPVAMTAGSAWVKPMTAPPAGLTRWSAPDAVTGATPMLARKMMMRAGQLAEVSGVGYVDLLLGNRAGSTGETFPLALLAGGIFILLTRTASWQIVLSCLASHGALGAALYYLGIPGVPDPLFSILSGGFLLGLFFMTTDPVSAPSQATSKWIYGGGIGCLTVVIRAFSIFSGGMMFAILVMNTFAPITDWCVRAWRSTAKHALENQAQAPAPDS